MYRTTFAGVVLTMQAGACSSGAAAPSTSVAPPIAPIVVSASVVVTSAIVESVPAGFCELAVQATEGSIRMDVDLSDNELFRFPGLSDTHRSMVRSVVADAIPLVRSGDGFDTTRLVELVNSICGLKLTPVIMQP
jgi:hypothetical protein